MRAHYSQYTENMNYVARGSLGVEVAPLSAEIPLSQFIREAKKYLEDKRDDIDEKVDRVHNMTYNSARLYYIEEFLEKRVENITPEELLNMIDEGGGVDTASLVIISRVNSLICVESGASVLDKFHNKMRLVISDMENWNIPDVNTMVFEFPIIWSIQGVTFVNALKLLNKDPAERLRYFQDTIQLKMVEM